MEARKQKGTSSSSFSSELFGSKESQPSPSSGIFGSIFSPQSPKVLGRESLRSELNGKIANESLKIRNQDGNSKGNKEMESENKANEDMSWMYEDQRVQPCHLSSSIMYGAQDIYSQPQSTHNSGYTSSLKNEGLEDDSGSASRGNWWQGGLYY
ncbi:hypothetical protein HN51_048085 [Arachis hypogaea]|uniref:Uncharacterized protein n=1 Tax=Arachis hypogaea TaxID=3818 RepID=A0A445AJG2_ARAHY|nr:uncharacterized protein LOC107625627 [Arachis ipaensis]XP_025633532.1 uncharacterized protein LOC112727831 [Arachis hypogaea]QHO24565.1 uncharacterized protein DS421_12g373310 [Arachis hypogaea]RYR26607.1 hypothetical protein Ahy_B02g060873 [Arachis hypogaea]